MRDPISTFKDIFRRRFGPAPRYIFHHLPKCGGTSVRHALENWFHPIKDYRPAGNDAAVLKEYFRHPYDLDALRAEEVLCSHFEERGSHLHERYPAALASPRFRIFTFVRDPLEVQLSLYFHEKRLGAAQQPLEAHLLLRPNYLAARLPCTLADYREKLRRYFFIGRLDRGQESFDRLAARLGKPPLKLPVKNRSKRESLALSPSFAEEFRGANELDYLLYEECCRIYETGA